MLFSFCVSCQPHNYSQKTLSRSFVTLNLCFSKKLMQCFLISKTRTTPFHLNCMNVIRKRNRIILNVLATTADDVQDDWSHESPFTMIVFGCSIPESTRHKPQVPVTGEKINIPIDTQYPLTEQPKKLTILSSSSKQRLTCKERTKGHAYITELINSDAKLCLFWNLWLPLEARQQCVIT